jgi:hypothetical protein
MKKLLIRAINFSLLRNEAHYEFLFVVFNLLQKYQYVQTLIQQFWSEYRSLLESENQLLDAARKSPLTKKLVELDKRIDNDIVGIKTSINANLHYFDPVVVNAAQTLYDRMKDFGNIKSKAYEEESAAVQVLIRDLQNMYSSQMNLLGLDDWVNDLANAEIEFTQLFEERNSQLAARPLITLREIRALIEPIYRDMIACINSDLLLNGEGVCGEFAKELNKEIKYFMEHSHRRAKTDIKIATVKSIGDQVYTGKQILIMPNVFYKEENKPEIELIFATDFSLTYKNNINPGNATIIIHGKGKYNGQKVVMFTIVRE